MIVEQLNSAKIVGEIIALTDIINTAIKNNNKIENETIEDNKQTTTEVYIKNKKAYKFKNTTNIKKIRLTGNLSILKSYKGIALDLDKNNQNQLKELADVLSNFIDKEIDMVIDINNDKAFRIRIYEHNEKFDKNNNDNKINNNVEEAFNSLFDFNDLEIDNTIFNIIDEIKTKQENYIFEILNDIVKFEDENIDAAVTTTSDNNKSELILHFKFNNDILDKIEKFKLNNNTEAPEILILAGILAYVPNVLKEVNAEEINKLFNTKTQASLNAVEAYYLLNDNFNMLNLKTESFKEKLNAMKPVIAGTITKSLELLKTSITATLKWIGNNIFNILNVIIMISGLLIYTLLKSLELTILALK